MSSTSPALRLLLFLAAGSSGAALLSHVYGIVPMRETVPFVVLPATALLIVGWMVTRRGLPDIADALSVGAIGGLLGTVAYDIVRVPFMLAGQRIFVPIRVYGLWIVDASASSAFSDAIGWTYHSLNGITFGIMYALIVPRRPVILAVAWAFSLETIAVVSPFGRIFGLWGAWGPLGIAYIGHVAYGLPLGVCVRRWDGVRQWQSQYARGLGTTVLLVSLMSAVVISRLDRDHGEPPVLSVSMGGFHPDIVRVARGDALRIENLSDRAVMIERLPMRDTVRLRAGSTAQVVTTRTGIQRLRITGNPFVMSALVLVEPVYDLLPLSAKVRR